MEMKLAKMKDRVKKLVSYTIEYVKYLILFPIALIIYRSRNIYLIAERGDEARDNAYHLFKYYRTNHPELEVYYVISKTSADRNKVIKYGNVVEYRSIKHYLLFIAAKYKISTHIMGFSTNRIFFSFYMNIVPIRGKLIFLQHGITKDDLPGLYAERTKLDLFICGAKPEYDFIKEHFHYGPNIVQYTGFARYDDLENLSNKNKILIMPTWRQYLKYKSNDEVANSDFVRMWQEVLSDTRIIEILEMNDIELIFYPHYEMQKHIEMFVANNDRVVIASSDKYDIQALLKEAALLITDYSSVFFDFSYMRKPCVFFQFDRDEFVTNHYAKGYFDYDKMGFGPVFTDKSTMIDYLERAVAEGFLLEPVFRSRIEKFFPFADKSNCERIFHAIETL